MAVAVQMPGYRPGTATGLADILNAASNIYTGSKQREALSTQTAGKEIENKSAQAAYDANKSYLTALSNPDSPETANTRTSSLAQVAAMKGAGLGDPKFLDAIGSSIQDPTKTPTGIAVQRLMSPLQQVLDLDKAKISGGAAATRAKVQEQNSQQASNSQYTQAFGPVDDTILSANKALGIIKRIKSMDPEKRLTSTSTLKQELASNLAQMYARGGQMTMSGTEHARSGLESAQGSTQERLNYIFGGADDTIANQQLNQLEKELGATKEELGSGRKNFFNSWINGIPEEHQQSLKNRFNSFSSSAVHTKKEKPEGGNADHAIGTVMDGYKFNGGNWNDQKSWSKAPTTAGNR